MDRPNRSDTHQTALAKADPGLSLPIESLLVTLKTLLSADAVELYTQSVGDWIATGHPSPIEWNGAAEQAVAAAADALSARETVAWETTGQANDALPPGAVAPPLQFGQLLAIAIELGSDRSEPLSPAVLLIRQRPAAAIDHRQLQDLARLLVPALRWHRDLTQMRHRNEDLQRLLEWSIQWSALDSTEELLNAIAAAATELLAAERASIFLWDKRRGKLVGRPALGVPGGQLEVDADAGIVGAVLRTGQPQAWTAGEDQESEVNRSVDRRLQFVTQSLLAVRLENAAGQPLGVFEVINKQAAEQTTFDARDQQQLDELARHAATALQVAETRQRLTRTRDRLLDDVAANYPIIGDSPVIDRLRQTLTRVAPTDLAVLVLGENGTGKEVVARSLHFQSLRRDQPFVAVNCAALVESLLESELFGHERGAFTDAHQSRPGKFELASGGTLFLDEIGDMSPGGQAKLLRVLEEKVVVRVGGRTPIAVDVRIVAATNQSLPELVTQKRFREDLFFRLNVVSVQLPPLRQRGNDILLLGNRFLDEFAQQIGRPTPQLSAAAADRLLAHRWPGNVRELRNVMQRVSYLVPGPLIAANDLGLERSSGDDAARIATTAPGHTLPLAASPAVNAAPAIQLLADDLLAEPLSAEGTLRFENALAAATRLFQVRWIEDSIAASGGNVTAAAQRLGLHRSNLYRKMRQLGMQVADTGAAEPTPPLMEERD